MKIQDILDKTVPFLKTKAIESARLDTELLVAHALNLKNRIDIYLQLDRPLNEKEVSSIRELIRRRSQLEPVAYILGYRHFYKSCFTVNSDVLIPRPESEMLVEHALEFVLSQTDKEFLRIADLGSGSGCIGLSIAQELEKQNKPYEITLIDFSAKALATAEMNAQNLQLPAERVKFSLQDLNHYKPHENFDLVVGNPPYIAHGDKEVDVAVDKYEPHIALYSEENGLLCLKTWLSIWSEKLNADSFLMFEMGYQQRVELEEFLFHFKSSRPELQKLEFEFVKDLNRKDRFVKIKSN